MAKKHVVRVLPDGTIQFIDKPELAELKTEGAVESRRASHVEPVGRFLRWLFHRLRSNSSETGAVATFTRLWLCRWRVNLTLSGGPILAATYRYRLDAIEAEIQWLQANKLGARQPLPVSQARPPSETSEK